MAITFKEYLRRVEKGLRTKKSKSFSPEISRLERSVLTQMDLSDATLERALQLDLDQLPTTSKSESFVRAGQFSKTKLTKKDVYRRIRQIAGDTMRKSSSDIIRTIVGNTKEPDYFLAVSFVAISKSFFNALKTDRDIGNLLKGQIVETLPSGQDRVKASNRTVFDKGHITSVSQRSQANVALAIAKSGITNNPKILGIVDLLEQTYAELNKESLDIEVEHLRRLTDDFFQDEFEFIIPESILENQSKSAEEKRIFNKHIKPHFSRLVNELIKELPDTILNAKAADILDIASSPSGYDLVGDLILEGVTKKKAKRINKREKGKIAGRKRKASQKQEHYKLINKNKRTRKKAIFNVQTMLAAINSVLHAAIKSNMGDGSSSTKLNYRTGRFAESAEAVSIQQRGDALQVFYRYMNNPYDVFAPGGSKHLPGRNPKTIIGRSVRQVGIELFRQKIIASEAK